MIFYTYIIHLDDESVVTAAMYHLNSLYFVIKKKRIFKTLKYEWITLKNSFMKSVYNNLSNYKRSGLN